MERDYAEQRCKKCSSVIAKGDAIVLVSYGDTPSPFPSMGSAHGALAPSGQEKIRFTPREEWFHLACYREMTGGASSGGRG